MKKKHRIRKGSIAWYVSKYWKMAFYIAMVAMLAVIFASCTLRIEWGETNTQQQTEKPVEANFVPSTAEEMICVECDKYGVDAELAIAIAKLETGHFTSEAYTEGNNVGGLSQNEQPIAFKDLEQGVKAFVMNLHHNYYAEGLDTVEEIAPKYCPLNADRWAEAVTEIMEG